MKSKGFTLIELLAVIVILAIIAIIATPIVLNIISESKESATLQSAQFYMDAVETAVAKKIMDEPAFRPTSCDIQADGNLKCNGIDVKVEIKGETPTSGTINLLEGTITGVTLVLSEKTIVKNTEGKLVYGGPSKILYTIGEKVTFNPGDQDRTWNVIGEDNDTVTLMLSENLGNAVAWYAYSNHDLYDNSYGPKDALEYLNSLTTGWSNVDPISSYNYINNLDGINPYGYQKIDITNGVTSLTHKDGNITILEGISKARLLTFDEVLEIAGKTKETLTEDNLHAYISENLESLNVSLETSWKTVDEAIEILVQEGEFSLLDSKKLILYYLAAAIYDSGIDTTYDLFLPNYLYQNLSSDKEPYEGYYTFSTSSTISGEVYFVDYIGVLVADNSDYDSDHNDTFPGVRPVITISKTKLSN